MKLYKALYKCHLYILFAANLKLTKEKSSWVDMYVKIALQS